MKPRQLRGAQIARAGEIQQRDEHLWIVKAQSNSGSWVVDYDNEDGQPTCTCPDFAERWKFCKHIFAIEIYEKRLSMPDAKPEQKKYTQDWAAYSLAQVNEGDHFVQLLYALCKGIDEPAQVGRGRPRTPLADRVFACVLKTYEGKSGRRTASTIRRCRDDGLLTKAVSYNSVSDYLKSTDMTPLLRVLVQESALPLAVIGAETDFAVDSTGFSTHTYGRWHDHKWGGKKSDPKERRNYVKAHAICGVRTNICTDLLVNDRGDATQFKGLVDATSKRWDMVRVSADKAYSSHKNIAMSFGVGAVPYIPFKDGTTGKGPEAWEKAYLKFKLNRAEFDKHYHQRSNVETMFSMVKGKFDAFVRSKHPVAQANEVYCKFLAHNIVVLIHAIYEMDLKPEFWPDGELDMRRVEQR